MFEGESLSNNINNKIDIFYSICINDNPIQVPDQERRWRTRGWRKETAWEKYQVEKKAEETKNEEEAGRKKTDGQNQRRQKKMTQEEEEDEDKNTKSLTLNGRTIKTQSPTSNSKRLEGRGRGKV